MKKLIIVSTVAALAAVVYVGFFREASARRRADTDEPNETAAEKVVHVHHHTTQIIREGAPPSAAEPAAQTGVPREIATTQAPPTEAERSTFAEREFREQTVDPAWKSETESGIRSRIERVPHEGVRVTDLECRSTLCRVAVESAEVETGREYSERLRRSDVWPGPGMLVRAQNGHEAESGQPFLMTFFFAKPDTKLPVRQ